MTVVAMLAAGAAGAVLRYLVESRVDRAPGRWPWGMFSVNAAGSALLGAVIVLISDGRVPPAALPVVGTGLCGALTTFSGFSLATLDAAGRSRARGAALVAGMVVGCAVAAAAGGAMAGVR